MSQRIAKGRQELRWGLLSTARINRALLGPLDRSPRSRAWAVASRTLDRARAYAERAEIPKPYGSYEELLSDSEIDVVYVSLPNHLHCEWTVAAAEAGKHVLCEKPLVLSLEDMDRVEAAAVNSGVTVFEAFMYLHHPQTLQLQSMVRAGELGQLKTIRSHFAFYLPPDSENVRLRPEMGGGSLWDVGVYPVSLAVVMANAGVPIQVFGTRQNGETGVDVGFEGTMRFANDVIAQISCGFRSPPHWGATLVGSEGVLEVDEPWKPGFAGTVSSVEIRTLDGERSSFTFSEPDPYACEIAAMEACVLDGAAPVVPLALSREILRAVLGLQESAVGGRPISPSSRQADSSRDRA